MTCIVILVGVKGFAFVNFACWCVCLFVCFSVSLWGFFLQFDGRGQYEFKPIDSKLRSLVVVLHCWTFV